jgi:hypothetical protein
MPRSRRRRGAPIECPGCKGFWDRPSLPDEEFTPLQHLGVGLRRLLEHVKAAATAGGSVPYRVRLEVRDPSKSLYGLSDA